MYILSNSLTWKVDAFVRFWDDGPFLGPRWDGVFLPSCRPARKPNAPSRRETAAPFVFPKHLSPKRPEPRGFGPSAPSGAPAPVPWGGCSSSASGARSTLASRRAERCASRRERVQVLDRLQADRWMGGADRWWFTGSWRFFGWLGSSSRSVGGIQTGPLFSLVLF